MKSVVIAVCGSSAGVGKSTLVNRLSEVIPDSSTLYFDTYHETKEYPPDIFEMIAAGQEVNPRDMKSPLFDRDLQELIAGHEIIDPANRKIKKAKTIIIEEPFGRSREGMREIVDILVCIHLPLDIALARRILRNMRTDFPHCKC